MGRGNPENLRAAAQRKHQATTARATTTLDELARTHQVVTFRTVARAAGVSVDFLYRSPLRSRIEQLRAAQQTQPPSPRAIAAAEAPSQSNVVRTLTAQLADLKGRHHRETTELKAALAAAHGENLQLRRQLGRPPTA